MKCCFCSRQDRRGAVANPNCQFAERYPPDDRTLVSDCCGAGVQIFGLVTQYYVCDKCGKACDAEYK